MDVTIIGSGNVATVMGRVLLEKGYTIHQVYSRDNSHAKQLAFELQAEAISDLAIVDDQADIYLIAVTDTVLPELANKLSLKNKLVIHTAGSVSKDVLQTVSTNYGVLWPMKMIRKSMIALSPVTMVVDGSSESVMQGIEQLAAVFSKVVTRADDMLRLKMHLLAAITSNFTNHLYHLAADYCEKENIDFSLFYSIIEETAHRIQSNHPKEIQAGPAFRRDEETLKKHEQLLETHPRVLELYRCMTESIQKVLG